MHHNKKFAIVLFIILLLLAIGKILHYMLRPERVLSRSESSSVKKKHNWPLGSQASKKSEIKDDFRKKSVDSCSCNLSIVRDSKKKSEEISTSKEDENNFDSKTLKMLPKTNQNDITTETNSTPKEATTSTQADFIEFNKDMIKPIPVQENITNTSTLKIKANKNVMDQLSLVLDSSNKFIIPIIKVDEHFNDVATPEKFIAFIFIVSKISGELLDDFLERLKNPDINSLNYISNITDAFLTAKDKSKIISYYRENEIIQKLKEYFFINKELKYYNYKYDGLRNKLIGMYESRKNLLESEMNTNCSHNIVTHAIDFLITVAYKSNKKRKNKI